MARLRVLIIVGAIVLFVIVIGGVIYAAGVKGLLGLLDSFVSILIWVLLFVVAGLIAYFLLFYEKRVNVSQEVFKDIKRESKLSMLPNLRSLVLSGDGSFSRPIEIGKVIGFSSRKNYSTIVKNNPGDEEDEEVFQNETIFLVKKRSRGLFSMISGLFTAPVVIRVPAHLHSDLHGDVIVKCNSLVKHGYFYYPDTIHLDTRAIDTTIYNEGERYIQINFVSKLEPILSRAVGVTKEDLKLLRGKTGLEMVREKGDAVMGGPKQQPYYPYYPQQ
jgi:hypothetical protein